MMTEPSPSQQAADAVRLREMIIGYWTSQIVRAVAHFSIADLLSRGPAKADRIAAECGTDPDATARLMRACVTLGLATYDPQHGFGATSLMSVLREGPSSMRSFALALAAPGHWLPWGQFLNGVMTGEIQTKAALGEDIWGYYADHPDEQTMFTNAMGDMTEIVSQELVRHLDMRGVATIADIGGAGGALLMPFLLAHPNLRGIVFDRPGVVDSVAGSAGKYQVADRLKFVAGDFFDSVPAAELYFLKHILHDWDDRDCIRILRSIARAMRPGSRLVVIELQVGDLTEDPGWAAILDLNMLVMTGSSERTTKQYAELFEAAGLRLEAATATQASYVLMTAVLA